MAIQIKIRDHYEYTLIEIQGTIDKSTYPLLDDALEKAQCEGNQKLVLDCSQLYSMNSDGLRVLFNHSTNRHNNCNLTLCSVSQSVLSLLEISGVYRYLSVIGSLDELDEPITVFGSQQL